MNLTNSPTDENLLRRFFVEQLVPITLKLQKDGIRFFSLGPDDRVDDTDEDSWYVTYPDKMIELSEFDPVSLEADLLNLWESQGLSQLSELAKPIAELTQRIKMTVPSDDSEVSPFIYVMF